MRLLYIDGFRGWGSEGGVSLRGPVEQNSGRGSSEEVVSAQVRGAGPVQ